MNKPHKHAEVIKAWADGAIIQWKSPSDNEWKTVTRFANFFWYEHLEYRVKPDLKDPGEVLKNAWYTSLGIQIPRGNHQRNAWEYAARELIRAYNAGELKDI